MGEDAKQEAMISWGLSLIVTALAFVLGGPYWGWGLIAIGGVLVLHGYFPELFASKSAKIFTPIILIVVIVGLVILSPFGRKLRHAGRRGADMANSVHVQTNPKPSDRHSPTVESSSPSAVSRAAIHEPPVRRPVSHVERDEGQGGISVADFDSLHGITFANDYDHSIFVMSMVADFLAPAESSISWNFDIC